MIKPHENARRVLLGEENLRRMTLSEFEFARGEEGLRFELIDGVLEVSPAPEMYHQDIVVAVIRLLDNYRAPDGKRVFAQVNVEPRIFVDVSEEHATVPQPDVAAYLVYPPKPVYSARGVFPSLVVEVLSPHGRAKDLVRNVRVYGDVPSILEYWVIDPLKNAARPALTVFRRASQGAPFERLDVLAGATYSSDIWQGLSIDLARIGID